MTSFVDRMELLTLYHEWADDQGIGDTNDNLLSFLAIYNLLNKKAIRRFVNRPNMFRDVEPEYK